MTNDNDARGALTVATVSKLAQGFMIGANYKRFMEEIQKYDDAPLPAGDGLTERKRFDAWAAKHMTMDGYPAYTAWDAWQAAILAAPRQPGEMGAGVPDYMNMQHVGVFCNVNSDSERPRWEQMQEGYNGDGAVHLYRRKPTNVDLSPEWCLAAVQREMAASAQQDDGGDETKWNCHCGNANCAGLHPNDASAQQDEREASEAENDAFTAALRRAEKADPSALCSIIWHAATDYANAQQVQADTVAAAWIVEGDYQGERAIDWYPDEIKELPIGTKLYLRPAAESDKRDAERYRFIRDPENRPEVDCTWNVDGAEEFDRNVDVAMSREQSGGDRG